MKIRAKANGEVLDASEAAATELIEAGIYESVDAPNQSTIVEPLTTKDLPRRAKKGKAT